jgi:hypothetical protein
MTQQQLFSQFTEGELATLKKAMEILGKLFPDSKPIPLKPKVALHGTTRIFLEEVEKQFQNEWINRKDPVLKQIMRKHYVKDLFTMLKQYYKNDLIEVVRQDNERQTILKFRFV